MYGKVFLHVNEQGVHHSKYIYMLKKDFFSTLSLSLTPLQKKKKKKKLFEIVEKKVNKQYT